MWTTSIMIRNVWKKIIAIARDRQWVITEARKGSFTSADVQQQLSVLTMQEVQLKHELSSLGHAININSLHNCEAKVSEYLADLQVGIGE